MNDWRECVLCDIDIGTSSMMPTNIGSNLKITEDNIRIRVLTTDDIKTISDVYHNWRNPEGKYENVKGFCASMSLLRAKELDHVLSPGRYVGLPDEEDDFDFDFAERFATLQKEFAAQLEEEKQLNAAILESLGKVKI